MSQHFSTLNISETTQDRLIWKSVLPQQCYERIGLWQVSANLRRMLQCSCLMSPGPKKYLPKNSHRFSAMAQQLPKRCRLMSFSSLQSGHRGSSILLNKVRCLFSVLCQSKDWLIIASDSLWLWHYAGPYKFTYFTYSCTAYCVSRMLTAFVKCLAWRQFLMLRHRLFCSCTDHWKILYLIFISDNPRAYAGQFGGGGDTRVYQMCTAYTCICGHDWHVLWAGKVWHRQLLASQVQWPQWPLQSHSSSSSSRLMLSRKQWKLRWRLFHCRLLSHLPRLQLSPALLLLLVTGNSNRTLFDKCKTLPCDLSSVLLT